MKRINRENVKVKFENEKSRCLENLRLSKEDSAIFDKIFKKLDVIKNLSTGLNHGKFSIGLNHREDSPRFEEFHSEYVRNMDKYHKRPSDYLDYGVINEISKDSFVSEKVYNEKIKLVEFICKSLNCGKPQITFGSSFSSLSGKFDTKEYLKRDIIVHLGNLVSSFTISEVEDRIIFPKFVTGSFKIYLPPSADYSKIVYPEYIFGEIGEEKVEILINNNKFFSE